MQRVAKKTNAPKSRGKPNYLCKIVVRPAHPKVSASAGKMIPMHDSHDPSFNIGTQIFVILHKTSIKFHGEKIVTTKYISLLSKSSSKDADLNVPVTELSVEPLSYLRSKTNKTERGGIQTSGWSRGTGIKKCLLSRWYKRYAMICQHIFQDANGTTTPALVLPPSLLVCKRTHMKKCVKPRSRCHSIHSDTHTCNH